jgi:hypothetical protein
LPCLFLLIFIFGFGDELIRGCFSYKKYDNKIITGFLLIKKTSTVYNMLSNCGKLVIPYIFV